MIPSLRDLQILAQDGLAIQALLCQTLLLVFYL